MSNSAADSPIQTTSTTRFNVLPFQRLSHYSGPLSSSASVQSHDGSCVATSSPSGTPVPEANESPDLVASVRSLRFGDIPASSFPVSDNVVKQNSLFLKTMGITADVGHETSSEVKILNRSQSIREKEDMSSSYRQYCSASDVNGGGDVDLQSDTPCTEGATGHDEMCCCQAVGLCSSAGCTNVSPRLPEALLALAKYLPSNNTMDDEPLWSSADSWPALDIYSSDDFRMYEFKVRKCVRGRSHDWTECPFAHPGEKARRRDPRRYNYSGTACPDFRKGNCRRGDACEYSHGVFECWLHPTRYRTQPCKDGRSCRRRVCFFAHTRDQLRPVQTEGESPPSTPNTGSNGGSARSDLFVAAALSGGAYDGSPLRRALAGTLEGNKTLDMFLDDNANKNSCTHHHHHHHWISMSNSPSSTLIGFPTGSTSPSPMPSPVFSPASPLLSSSTSWMGVPGHRRHLDRLRSVPMISIPAVEEGIGSPPERSPFEMAELMSSLQSLEISERMVAQSCRPSLSASDGRPLSTQHQSVLSWSAPSTPEAGYLQANRKWMRRLMMGGQEMMQPVSSTEVLVESEIPDLDWVNELVQ